MKFKINAYVEPHYPIKRSLLTSTAQHTLETANVKGKMEVGISIIGDRKMRKLNRDYRKMDKTTDVLAFPSLETGKSKSFVNAPTKHLSIGDVLISYPQLIERAAKEEMMVDDTARLLVVHGVLHLLGYDHEKVDEAKSMEELEDKILSSSKVA